MDITVFNKILDLSGRAFQSLYSWIVLAGATFINFIAPEWYTFAAVLGCVLIDGVFGVIVSWRKKDFTLSKLGRVTVFKITSYGACLVMVFILEKIAHDDGFIGIKIAAAWACACEIWSFSASILIINPNAVFFKVLRNHLKGEIAAKLGVAPDDVFKD